MGIGDRRKRAPASETTRSRRKRDCCASYAACWRIVSASVRKASMMPTSVADTPAWARSKAASTPAWAAVRSAPSASASRSRALPQASVSYTPLTLPTKRIV